MNLCIKDLYLGFLTIIIFYLIYCSVCNKNKEGFDATSDMKAVIGQVYNADIEAIRNLSSIATQLQAGGITVPGNLIASDALGVSNDRPEGGRVSIRNPKKSGKGQTKDWSIWNMTGNYGDKLSFWRYNGDGENAGSALDIFDNGNTTIYGNATVGGTLTSGALNNSGNATINGDLSVKGRNILAELNRLNAMLPNQDTLILGGSTGGSINYGGLYFHLEGGNGQGVRKIAAGDGSILNWGGRR